MNTWLEDKIGRDRADALLENRFVRFILGTIGVIGLTIAIAVMEKEARGRQ